MNDLLGALKAFVQANTAKTATLKDGLRKLNKSRIYVVPKGMQHISSVQPSDRRIDTQAHRLSAFTLGLRPLL